MSLPITPTPILEGKEADNFLRRVEEGLKDPVGSVPTPKLGKAMELVKQISKERKMKDKEKIERLSDALAFYADPDTYFAIMFVPDSPCGGFIEDFSYDEQYDRNMPGEFARKVLKKVT